MRYLSGHWTPGSRRQAISAATAVLLAGVAAAGCANTLSSSSGGPTAPATTTGPTAPPSPVSPPPNPTQPANSEFPYEPGGVTYSGDLGGGVYTFSIPAGGYSLNRQASYNATLDPDGSGSCIFGGELDYLSGSGGSIPLGDGGVPVTAMVPLDGPPSEGNYAAGDYKIYIYPETTCSWTIMFWR